RLSKGVFEVISTGGDTALGGDDFDAAIVKMWVHDHKLTGLAAEDERALLVTARQMRETLTTEERAEQNLTLSTAHTLVLTLSHEQFEALATPLIARTLVSARRALRDADLSEQDIKGVVMVGGATRMPVVRQQVGAFFSQEPLTNLDPD